MTNTERNTDRKGKKIFFFTQLKVEALVREFDTHKRMLLGGHSTGITNAKKTPNRMAACGRCCICCYFRESEKGGGGVRHESGGQKNITLHRKSEPLWGSTPLMRN